MPVRYRRSRTRLEKLRLVDTIRRNFRRFFPAGVPSIFYAEWDERHRRGWAHYGPEKTTRGIVSFRHDKPTPDTTFSYCHACSRRFLYRRRRHPRHPPSYCTTRCSKSAELAAVFTVYPDWTALDPMTTELRLWCYTHDTLQRHPSETVNSVLTNLEPLLMTTPATQTLNQYFDERIALTTEQQDQLRLRIGNLIARQLPRANANLSGQSKKPWDAQQVRLFLGLLNKLVPDMTASMSLALTKNLDADTVDPSKMSREELEGFLAKELAKRAPRSPIIEPTPIFDHEINPVAPTPNKGHKNLAIANARRRAAKAAQEAPTEDSTE